MMMLTTLRESLLFTRFQNILDKVVCIPCGTFQVLLTSHQSACFKTGRQLHPSKCLQCSNPPNRNTVSERVHLIKNYKAHLVSRFIQNKENLPVYKYLSNVPLTLCRIVAAEGPISQKVSEAIDAKFNLIQNKIQYHEIRFNITKFNRIKSNVPLTL